MIREEVKNGNERRKKKDRMKSRNEKKEREKKKNEITRREKDEEHQRKRNKGEKLCALTEATSIVKKEQCGGRSRCG